MKRKANGKKKNKANKGSATEQVQNMYWRAEALTYFPDLPYHPTFAHLLTLSDEDDFEHPEAIGFKGSDIPFLVRVVRDVNCNKSSLARFARYVLAHIRWGPEHLDSIKLLMPIFNYEYPDDESEEENEEDILDKMHSVMLNIGELGIQPLRDYLFDITRRNRSDAAEILGSIAKSNELLRPRISEILVTALRRYKQEDPEINAFIVLALTDAQAVYALPLIREVYENNFVEEYVSGSWANVLDALGQEISADDDLVDLCAHCGRPTIICRKKENEKLMQVFQEHADEGMRWYNEANYINALQCFLCTYTLSVRLGTINHCFIPMVRTLMKLNRAWDAVVYLSFALGLWHQSAKEAQRQGTEVTKEIEKYYGLRAEAYLQLGETEDCFDDLVRVMDVSVLEADMRSLKIKLDADELDDEETAAAAAAAAASAAASAFAAQSQAPSAVIIPATPSAPQPPPSTPSAPHPDTPDQPAAAEGAAPTTPAVGAAPVVSVPPSPAGSAVLVKLGEPIRLSTRSRCCNAVEDVVKIAFDTRTYAFTSTCKSTTVAVVEDPQRAAVLTESVDVLALQGDALATANPETFAVDLWDLKGLHNQPPSGSAAASTAVAPVVPANGAAPANAAVAALQPVHVSTLTAHSSTILLLECDEQRVVAAARDLQIVVWDRNAPAAEKVYIWGHGGRVTSMKLRGRTLITAFDCVMLRYDAATGHLQHIYTDRSLLGSVAHDNTDETGAQQPAFSPTSAGAGAVSVTSFDFNERHLYSAWPHDYVIIHDLQTGEVLQRISVAQPRFLCLSRSLLAYTRKNTKQVHICDLNGTVIDENIILPGPLLHMTMNDNQRDGSALIYCKTANNDLYRVPFVLRPPNGCYRCGLVESATKPFKACGKCKSVKYCSEDCQRVDWIEHHKKRCRPKAQ